MTEEKNTQKVYVGILIILLISLYTIAIVSNTIANVYNTDFFNSAS